MINKTAFMAGFADKAKKFGRGLANTPAAIGGGIGFGAGALGGAGIVYAGKIDKNHPMWKNFEPRKELVAKHKKEKSQVGDDPKKIREMQKRQNEEMKKVEKKFKRKAALIAGTSLGLAVGLNMADGAAKATGGWGTQSQWFRAGAGMGGGRRAGASYGSATVRQARKILGLEGVKTKAEAKKAFRRKAMKHHPDRGGSVEKMKEVNDAWEVFSKSDDFRKMAMQILGI